MKYIHPAAWAGLFLNFFLAWLLFTTLVDLDLSIFEGEDRLVMEEIQGAILMIRPLYYGLLGLQAIAVGLIATQLPFGLGLAAISAFFMLPGSIIYLIGCALSHYRSKYAAFSVAPQGYPGAHFIYAAYAARKMQILGLACLLSFGICTVLGQVDIAFIFLGFALAGLYCTLRARKRHSLTLHDDFFTLSPALLAEPLAVMYTHVRKATLQNTETISFDVETPDGVRSLLWSLRTIDPKERRSAVEELGAALAWYHVPLY